MPLSSSLFIGYETVEVKATAEPMRIVLKENTQMVDEVVVTALGIKREKEGIGLFGHRAER